MGTVTPETIAELRRLLAEAKPASPWAVDQDDRPSMEYNNHIVVASAPHMRICFMAHDGPAHQDEWDAKAALIVATVNALPALLDAAEISARWLMPSPPHDAHKPYYPAIIEHPDAGIVEFVLRDCATITEYGEHYDRVLDMDTREVIGFIWPIGTNPSLAPAASPSRPAEGVELETTAEERAAWRRIYAHVADVRLLALLRDFDRLLASRDAAAREEREACARIADSKGSSATNIRAIEIAGSIAAAIRARGNT